MWYSETYSFASFPPISANEARKVAFSYIQSKKLTGSLGTPILMTMPDKCLYWVFSLIMNKETVTSVYVNFAFPDKVYTEDEIKSSMFHSNKTYRKGTVTIHGENRNTSKFTSYALPFCFLILFSFMLYHKNFPLHSFSRKMKVKLLFIFLIPTVLPSAVVLSNIHPVAAEPQFYTISGVPHHYQLKNYYCGPASLEMVFDYYGSDVLQYEIADVARTAGYGTFSDDMRRAAHFSNLSTSVGTDEPAHSCTGYTGRDLGYAAFEHAPGSLWLDSLESLIAMDYPIVVLTWYDASHSSGHFRVVIGYDASMEEVIVHDPWNTAWGGVYGGPNVHFSYATFQDLWSYSSYWGLFTHPWIISIDMPTKVNPGSTFTVEATITYPCPSPYSATDYPASSCQSTITLPSGFSLAAGETATKTLGTGSMSAGSSVTISWNVVAAETPGPYTITVSAEGRISGDVSSHGTYSAYSYIDRIGGSQSSGITVKNPIELGLNWLREHQNPDGSWTYSGRVTEESVGLTSMATIAFLNYGVDESDPTVNRAINWILSKQRADGCIVSQWYEVYDTSLAILALVATRNNDYYDEIRSATEFLIRIQNDKDTGYSESNQFYGGWSYQEGLKNWADLSNSQFALLALWYAEQFNSSDTIVPESVWNKAEIFVTRCQNREASNPDYSFYDDGGFIYQPGSTIWANGHSYGSMTAAGLWGLFTCGVGKDDGRIKDAWQWLENNYYVDQNYPLGTTLLYYYLYSLAKACVLWNVAEIAGHAWYTEITDFLVKNQQSDGHWAGTDSMEEPDMVATCWALLALESKVTVSGTGLYVKVDSPADLHINDPEGRHVGINYITGEVEIEIPGASYSGPATEPQVIIIPNPMAGNYRIELVGREHGNYTLTIEGRVNNETVYSRSFEGSIDVREKKDLNAIISAIAGPITIDIPDTIPPDAITDLTIINATFDSITLTWTAPGDDWNTGVASKYDIRYSTKPITEENWDEAIQCVGEPAPQSPGSVETFVITGLNSSAIYYFAIKTADEIPNWSELSNVVRGTTWIRDIVIANVLLSTNASYAGRIITINVTVSNLGETTETFNVSLFYDNNLIGTILVEGLPSYTNITITFYWDTTGVNPCTYYNITAKTDVLPGEINTTNNILQDGKVKIKILGDVNGDDIVDLVDMYTVALAFGEWPGRPYWNAQADINNDGIVDLMDVYIVCQNFGKCT